MGGIALQLYKIKYASVAQSVEQRIRNAQVGGSSPFTSSIKYEPLLSTEAREVLFSLLIA